MATYHVNPAAAYGNCFHKESIVDIETNASNEDFDACCVCWCFGDGVVVVGVLVDGDVWGPSPSLTRKVLVTVVFVTFAIISFLHDNDEDDDKENDNDGDTMILRQTIIIVVIMDGKRRVIITTLS